MYIECCRTDNAVKNRFNSTLKKRARSESARWSRDDGVLGRPTNPSLLSKSVVDLAEIVLNMSKTIVPGTLVTSLAQAGNLTNS